MSFYIDICDQASPVLDQISAALNDRSAMNESIGRAVEYLCKTYVQQDAPTRHNTASALGAQPTGFLQSAAGAIHYIPGEDGGVIDFNHPWFARVAHDVDIFPGTQTPGADFLIIPQNAAAYGHRYSKELKQAGAKWLYVTSVHQTQDRTRLPSDEEIMRCIRDTAVEQIH